MAEHETHEYDVVVIGAGGAGLRAAIEAHDRGARTALVCKSLLGKAHTVMAEGGIAAAMGNVYPDDNWRVHFRDTMRGGKMLNSWRMAQLHAQEAPDRVYELEEWGALFDRTDDGRILQRDFGGHRFARLAHVGDRTGLAMIRTLQHRAVSTGVEVFMECTVMRLLTADGRIAGAVAYWRESGRLIVFRAKAVVLATGGIGKAWKVTSNSWEYTGDGHALALWAGPTWSTWSSSSSTPPAWSGRPASAASWSPRGCAATAGCYATARASGSCSTTSPRCSGRRRPGPRRRPTAGTTTARTTAAPPTCCPVTRSPGPSTPRSRRAGAAPTAGSSWTSPRASRPTTSSAACPRCTTSSRSWPTSTSPGSRWRSARPATT